MQAKSLLYARRLKGDLDLGLEPARINADGGRSLARILTPGGLLPGGSFQNILAVSPVTQQNYRLGTRMAVDERVYRYSHVSTDGEVRGGWGAAANMPDTEWGTLLAIHGVGVTTLACTSVGIVGLNQFAGGYMVCPNHMETYKIISNTATTGGGQQFNVVIEEGLVTQINAATEFVSLFANPYANVFSSAGIVAAIGLVTWIGVPNRTIPANNFGWLQTWGPCEVAYNLNYGAVVNERGMDFQGDGAVVRRNDPICHSQQYAGSLLPRTDIGGAHNVTGGSQLLWLNICP